MYVECFENCYIELTIKVASHSKCDHFGEKIFYDSKIDLTPIFALKKKFRKNTCILSSGSYGQNSVFFTNCR